HAGPVAGATRGGSVGAVPPFVDGGRRVSDGSKHPPSQLLVEAASIFYLLGGRGSTHLVIVGGMVPPLLVPEAAEAHVGSSDIDLCLSVAFVEGNTRQYYKGIQDTIEPYFEPAVAS